MEIYACIWQGIKDNIEPAFKISICYFVCQKNSWTVKLEFLANCSVTRQVGNDVWIKNNNYNNQNNTKIFISTQNQTGTKALQWTLQVSNTQDNIKIMTQSLSIRTKFALSKMLQAIYCNTYMLQYTCLPVCTGKTM